MMKSESKLEREGGRKKKSEGGMEEGRKKKREGGRQRGGSPEKPGSGLVFFLFLSNLSSSEAEVCSIFCLS